MPGLMIGDWKRSTVSGPQRRTYRPLRQPPTLRPIPGWPPPDVPLQLGATYTCLFPSHHVSADAITVTNDLVIGGEAVRADELIAAARACVRTEALIDIEIPGGDGISTARHWARSCRCAGL